MHKQFADPEQPLSHEAIIAQTNEIDPGLAEADQLFIEAGATLIRRVTELYGTPGRAQWAEGSREATIMLYHNGESAASPGHTSSGAHGAGVPRNALVIARAVNAQAGRELLSPNERARMFAAAAGHDLVQLCGRAAEFPRDGDETLSAQAVYNELRRRGASLEDAEDAAYEVLATTFDQGAQRIDYSRRAASILTQQIVASADLFGLTTPRGARGAVEYAVESLGLQLHGRLLQQHLRPDEMSPGASSTPRDLLARIEQIPALRARLIATVQSQAGFAANFAFSDQAVREACGASIDSLSPGRPATVASLQSFAVRAAAGEPLPAIWHAVCSEQA